MYDTGTHAYGGSWSLGENAVVYGYLVCGTLQQIHPYVRLPQRMVAAAWICEYLHAIKLLFDVAAKRGNGLLYRQVTAHAV